MKTKILSLILSLVMVITMVPKLELNVSADDSTITDEQGIKYKLNDDGTATVLGLPEKCPSGSNWNVVIPTEINGCRVTIIADNAFNSSAKSGYRGKEITVSFQSSNYLEIIGERAFEECRTPAGKIIFNNLKELGRLAFWRCRFAGIGASSLEDDGEYDSDDDAPHVSIEFSERLTKLGEHAFYGTYGLKEVKLSNEGLTDLNRAFESCFNLKKINLPNTLQKINTREFRECLSLRLTELPAGITEIGVNAFEACRQINIRKIPDNVSVLRYETFKYCHNMTHLELSPKLKRINPDVFYGSGIKSLNMPGVEIISDSAFFGCRNLASINSEKGSGIVNLPNSVNFIGEKAFNGCYAIKSVNIPASVKVIKANAFSSCSIENIIISPDVILEEVGDEFIVNRYAVVNVYIHCGDDKAEEKRLTDLLTRAVQSSKLNIINHPHESGRCLATDNNCGEF